ncbi:hypothetical protein ACSSMI_23370, partial [Escherichia coli]|uniref:hypothetical protein n=1 Tax=Escherichia coli TaxID=562 RepID=UPI003FD2F0A0
AAPSAKGDDKFITTDYLQQCPLECSFQYSHNVAINRGKGVVREANEAFCRRLHSFVNPFSKFDSNS